MIEWTSGDVLQATADYIAQGVATGSQEGLGTGLALKISTAWPMVQQRFKKHTRNAIFAGGDLFAVAPGPGHPGLIYLATQPDMYHATLPFLNRALRNLAKYCAKTAAASVALPKIGAGLGKLDRETEVKPLMIRHLSPGATLFLVYEDFKLEYEQPG
ncbi:MAG TPA: hypothetical protein VGE07_21510 [Herpetosiphonaceae bacterium]